MICVFAAVLLIAENAYCGGNPPSLRNDWEVCAIGGFLGLERMNYERQLPLTCGIYGKYKKTSFGYRFTTTESGPSKRPDIDEAIKPNDMFQKHSALFGYTYFNNRNFSTSVLAGPSVLAARCKTNYVKEYIIADSRFFEDTIVFYQKNVISAGAGIELQLFVKLSRWLAFGQSFSANFYKDFTSAGCTFYFVAGRLSKRSASKTANPL